MSYDPATHSYDGTPAWDRVSAPRYLGRIEGYVSMTIARPREAVMLPLQRIVDCHKCGQVNEMPAGIGAYVCRCGEPQVFDVDELIRDIEEVLREIRDEP